MSRKRPPWVPHWWRAAIVAAVALTSAGVAEPLRGQSEDEVHDLPVSESGMGSVAEDELSPTLESNRQPLGPDPLVLPQWDGEEVAAFEGGRPVNLGGGLWSADRYPLQPVLPWPPVSAPVRPVAPGVLNWEVMSQYGAARDWCVDPQRALDDDRRTRMESHLAAHARAAYHPVRLWVLAGGQSLAGSLDDATVHRASFGPEQPGVLVVLTAAEPMAARVLLPPVLAHRSASWRHALMARVASGSPPADQLEQIALWLTLQADGLPTLESAASASGLNVARTPVAPPAGLDSPYRRWWWLALAALATVGLAWRQRLRRTASESLEPPMAWLENDRPTRLGAPHSGGSGTVVEW